MRYKILRLASAAFAILLVACHEQSEYLFGADAPLVEISADAEMRETLPRKLKPVMLCSVPTRVGKRRVCPNG